MAPMLRNGGSRVINGYKSKLIDRISALNPHTAADLRNLKLPWYTIRNADAPPAPPPSPDKEDKPKEDEEPAAEILIYDEIGGSFGVSAEEFVTDLMGITAKNIDVRINSPGGSVFDAIAIYNALVKHPANVTTYVDALAASAASIIAMGGDSVVMMVGSQMMIHDAMGAEMGNARDFREMADFLDDQTRNIASIYAYKSGNQADIENWLGLMANETWMMAQEAVDLGLADSVYTRAVKREIMPSDEDPTEEPDSDEPEQGEPEPEKPAENDSDELENLMRTRHRLSNRGYKYSGRQKSPAPDVRASMLDGLIDNMLRKVNK